MKFAKKTILIAMTMSVFFFPAKQAKAASIDDPFAYYNVFSAGDINYTGSSIHGTVGAGGQVILTTVALSTANPFALHAGGGVSLGGNITGSIETAGNATLGGLTLHGSVYSGGTVANTPTGGDIYGNVAAQNITLDGHMNVTGTKQSGAAYTPNADLAAAATYFRTFSQDVAAKGATATVTNSNGWLQTSPLSSGINVVTLSASALNNAYKFTVNGPADAILYINVPGAQVALNYTDWTYSGGIASSDVLVNYFEASRLDLTSTNIVNILAPLAFTSFTDGSLTGNLIVDGLYGNKGSVNLGYFDDAQPVPEPSTLLLLLAGGLPFLLKRSFKRSS